MRVGLQRRPVVPRSSPCGLCCFSFASPLFISLSIPFWLFLLSLLFCSPEAGFPLPSLFSPSLLLYEQSTPSFLSAPVAFCDDLLSTTKWTKGTRKQKCKCGECGWERAPKVRRIFSSNAHFALVSFSAPCSLPVLHYSVKTVRSKSCTGTTRSAEC